ncbi:MAG: DNA-directed RNA polymerase, partial [Candidatus Lokiarchaeota archaeon]|nr:DNA-directed RNA polymerase [Candidatus Lokiarchaeota archaeon]
RENKNMFKLITLESTLEIPPFLYSQDKKISARIILSDDYEGTVTKEFGFIIAVVDVLDVGLGMVIPSSANTFHKVSFRILTFRPSISEVVRGACVEIVDFGAFIRLGPLDALVHVSQICDDYIVYEESAYRFLGKETGKILEVNDIVRARIIAVSLGGGRTAKLGLTMRQPFLGKDDWIERDLAEYYKDAEETEAPEEEAEKMEKKPASKKKKKK